MGKKHEQRDAVIDSFDVADEAALADLRENIIFKPEEADIRLGNRRMLLVDEIGLSLTRRELIQALGHDRARGVLSRIGYGIGVADAQFALDLRKGGNLLDVYRAGPQLHALKGAVKVEEMAFQADFKAGAFYGEYNWHNSAECLSHRAAFGVGTQPAGWQQVGYASGYASTFFGRPMVFRELRCVAMGHDHCYLVGKPADEWPDAEAELRWFRAETYNHSSGGKVPSGEKTNGDPSGSALGARHMVGASAEFNSVLHLVNRVAPTRAPVLFYGESGVGKEVFAREVHRRSSRSAKPMLALNCAAIPEALVEAELFGVEKGAYTGADAGRPGRFERAAGGTLFLDEIGTLSLAAQGKLLRVLQEGEFERVGGTRTLSADIRLIAATNADLRADVTAGRFRADLFHRLSTFPVHIPPLRERIADIPVLANHFLQRLSARHNRSGMHFSSDLIRYFHEYHWPGNIREMENLIERGIILVHDDEPIDVHHLTLGSVFSREGDGAAYEPDPFHAFVISRQSSPMKGQYNGLCEKLLDSGVDITRLNDTLIAAAVERSEGNLSAAARRLGMTRAQLNYWKKERAAR